MASTRIKEEQMKFRRLNKEELAGMEPEFINFLASNTVTGEDWVKLKADKPEKAEKLIDLFSDIVFEKIIKGITFLEFRTPLDVKIFQCLEDKIIMRGIMIQGTDKVDLRENPSPDAIMSIVKETNAKVRTYSAEKQYKPARDLELFKMLENGCLISKGELFETLEKLQ